MGSSVSDWELLTNRVNVANHPYLNKAHEIASLLKDCSPLETKSILTDVEMLLDELAIISGGIQ